MPSMIGAKSVPPLAEYVRMPHALSAAM